MLCKWWTRMYCIIIRMIILNKIKLVFFYQINFRNISLSGFEICFFSSSGSDSISIQWYRKLTIFYYHHNNIKLLFFRKNSHLWQVLWHFSFLHLQVSVFYPCLFIECFRRLEYIILIHKIMSFSFNEKTYPKIWIIFFKLNFIVGI